MSVRISTVIGVLITSAPAVTATAEGDIARSAAHLARSGKAVIFSVTFFPR